MKYVSPTFMTEPARFWEIAPETWKLLIDTNVKTPSSWHAQSCHTRRAKEWGDHQCDHELQNHEAERVLALRPVQSGS
jgi:hypothetical protein